MQNLEVHHYITLLYETIFISCKQILAFGILNYCNRISGYVHWRGEERSFENVDLLNLDFGQNFHNSSGQAALSRNTNGDGTKILQNYDTFISTNT